MTNSPDFFNYTDNAVSGSISQAIRRNDKNTLLQLLKKRKRNPLPLPVDNRNWTALHVAASRPQYKECLELLFEYRDSILLDVNALTHQGETALYIACENSCEENVRILLENGCDPCKKTLDEDTPLMAALARSCLRTVNMLLDHAENINQHDSQGLTPLHLAALSGYLEVSCRLLAQGADVRSTDSRRNLPLHLACQNDFFDVIRLLLERDSTTVNYQNSAGITPLMIAAECCHLAVVRFLVENGAETNVFDRQGRTPLHFTAYRGDDQMLEFLMASLDVEGLKLGITNMPPKLEEQSSTMYSLTCCAIHSKNAKCLDILVSSELPKFILQMPHIEESDGCGTVASPLAYLFQEATAAPNDEQLNECLHLLMKHGLVRLDAFFEVLQINWPHRQLTFIHPFSYIFDFKRPFSGPRPYFNFLIAHHVTTDYCLECFHDNNEPFDGFTEYWRYYAPVTEAIACGKIEILQLLMSNSAILEPDVVIDQLRMKPDLVSQSAEVRQVYRYLLSLKPVYYRPKRPGQIDVGRYAYSTVQEEFSKATLQQLCRTFIRRSVREATLQDNLNDFKSNIMKLPLPGFSKRYLLFER